MSGFISPMHSNMQKTSGVFLQRRHLNIKIDVEIPVNPPGIVTIKDSSFRIDANKMRPYEPCIVDFRGSKYLIWKDEDDALIEIW